MPHGSAAVARALWAALKAVPQGSAAVALALKRRFRSCNHTAHLVYVALWLQKVEQQLQQSQDLLEDAQKQLAAAAAVADARLKERAAAEKEWADRLASKDQEAAAKFKEAEGKIRELEERGQSSNGIAREETATARCRASSLAQWGPQCAVPWPSTKGGTTSKWHTQLLHAAARHGWRISACLIADQQG